MSSDSFPPFRVGLGYDIHRMAFGRPCVIGGVHIPHAFGPDGHSDGDVLTHAICDALLGGAGLPDIGILFPNTDPAFKNIDSQKLLAKVRDRVRATGWDIGNIDCTLIAERPIIAPYRETIITTLARTLQIPADRVGVKATTNERIDDPGRGLAIAAHAVAALVSTSSKEG